MATMMSTKEVIDTYIKENRPDLALFHILSMNTKQIQDFDAEQIQNFEIDIYYQMVIQDATLK